MISPRYRSDASYLKDMKIPFQANGYFMAEWHFYDREENRWIAEMQPLFKTIFEVPPAGSNDSSGVWYYEAVRDAAETGLMQGPAPVVPSPLGYMACQQIWTALARMAQPQ